jgi:hypothetical protein
VALAGRGGLTLSRLAFIHETSLSKPTGLRQSARLLLPRPSARTGGVSQLDLSSRRLGAGRFEVEADCKAQYIFFLLAPPGATPGDSKLIKEDHFLHLHAPRRCLRQFGETEGLGPSRRDLDQTASVHRNVWPHILAAFRLFTCQRALRRRLRSGGYLLRRRHLRVRDVVRFFLVATC